MTQSDSGVAAVELVGAARSGPRSKLGPFRLKIPQGYVVALVGPNGSGKSTMMGMMLQTLIPDEGGVRWFGSELNELIPLETRQQMAHVPEHPAVEENIMTTDQASKFRSYWYPEWDWQRYERLMDRFQVPRKEKLNRMSKGERRKFEIAAVMAARPKLMLLDEPSAGLDPFAWKDMIEELRRSLDEDGSTIVMATHIVEEIKRLADYIVLIHRGELLGMVEKDALLGSWTEYWIRGADRSFLAGMAGVVRSETDGPSILRVVLKEESELERRIESSPGGVQIIKSRSLELEEILELWMQGNKPDGLMDLY